MTTTARDFPMGRFEREGNPLHRGLIVKLEWNGRTLLGNIRDTYRDWERGLLVARVTHFNGEPWPIIPALYELTWIRPDWAKDGAE